MKNTLFPQEEGIFFPGQYGIIKKMEAGETRPKGGTIHERGEQGE